jgi:hypothetical protein
MHSKWVCVCVVLASAACADDSTRRFEAAKARYIELIDRGERPTSTAFDGVVEQLASVPLHSARGEQARQLMKAIELARTSVRRPLAKIHADDSDMPQDLRAQTRACAALAAMAGLDGGATPHVVRALDDCTRRIERLDMTHHRAHEPDVDDLSQRFGSLLDAGMIERFPSRPK